MIQLEIPDMDQCYQNFYLTEIGADAIGEALGDNQLFELYRDRGDAKGTIKLYVSHSHVPVHKQSSESLPSPSVPTIPPPVLPQHALYAPLRPRRRSKSRRGSMSSTSERIPPEAANGYEASVSDDLDQADRDSRRSTIRPPTTQHILPLVTAPRSRSPACYNRPQTPPNLLSPDRVQVLSPETQTLRPDRILGGNLPTPPLSTTSPQATRFNDEVYQAPSQWHGRSGSEAMALERDRSLQASDGQLAITERQLSRYQDPRVREERTRRKDSQPRREPGLRRARPSQHEPIDAERRQRDAWTVVPSGIPSSEYRKDRPTTPQDPPRPSGSSSPRFPATGSGSSISIPQQPRDPPPAPPEPSSEPRTRGRRHFGKAVPQAWSIAWRAPPKTQQTERPLNSPPTPPWSKMVAKSMNDLRGSYKQQSQIPTSLQPGKARPTPPQLPAMPTSRPSTSGSAPSVNGITPTNSSSGDVVVSSSHNDVLPYQELGIPKTFDNSRGGSHSPITGYHPSRPVNQSAYSAGSLLGISYPGLTSPGQEPPRPRSAYGNDPTTSPYRPSRQLQSPRTTDFSQEVISHHTSPAPSPHFISSGLSASSSGTVYDELSPSSTYGPRPSHATHPRSDSLSGIQVPRSPLSARNPTLEPNVPRPPEPAQRVERTLSSLPLKEDDEESTVRRDDVGRYIAILESEISGTMIPKARSPTPPRLPTPTRSSPPSAGVHTVRFDTINDDDSEGDEEDFWVKKPKKPAQSVDSTQSQWPGTLQPKRPILPPISTDSSPVSRSVALPNTSQRDSPNRTPSGNAAGPTGRPRRPPGTPPNAGISNLQDQRTSRFDNNYDYTWAPRPPPEEVFERLQEYFPEHDVDKPVIEAQSGGTSPTSAEHPPLPTPADKKFRHKKSIRVVAAEGKRRVDRISRVEKAAAQGSLRKRNTKLWGSRLQEVTSGEGKDEMALSAEASPGGGAKRESLLMTP